MLRTILLIATFLTIAVDSALPVSAKSSAAETASSDTNNGEGKTIAWHDFDESLFDKARNEKKLVLLDLEAVWCHWCHVMNDRTYNNREVCEILSKNFICIRVDQDSRPDLSHKYEDYGWPATVIFDGNGNELAKKTGYIPPEPMKDLLLSLVENPDISALKKDTKSKKAAKEDFSRSSILDESLRKELQDKHLAGYDPKEGGWGKSHKFLDWNSVEYSMMAAMQGDKNASDRAIKTLDAQLNLLDPVWGGIYQYSTGGVWKNPHFEKIMQVQAENMRIYSLAHLVLEKEPDSRYLKAARSIADYLSRFLLSPHGAFYTSQDADLVPGVHSQGYFRLSDRKRRERGIPRIDKHIYARENGWAILGLASLYMASGDKTYLDRAINAAEWIIEHRSLKIPPDKEVLSLESKGVSAEKSTVEKASANKEKKSIIGFSHDAIPASAEASDTKSLDETIFFGDTLAMARAFLALHEASGERIWLERACACADFIENRFDYISENQFIKIGFITAVRSGSVNRTQIAPPEPLLDENISAARFFNKLYRYSAKENHKNMAAQAMRFIASAKIARTRSILVAGPLIADCELRSSPLHITIVGAKSDSLAGELFRTALTAPTFYRRIDWYDKSEGPLMSMDVEFPDLARSAAFACSGNSCSSPLQEPEKLREVIRRNAKSLFDKIFQ